MADFESWIELWDWDGRGCGIIISRSSGTKWLQQAGGLSCEQRVLEGDYVRLGQVPEVLRDHFIGSKYRGRCDSERGIDQKTAAFIDRQVLRKGPLGPLDFLKVDRDRLRESIEAWVHLRIAPNQDARFANKVEQTGVLVWPNSD